MVAESEAPLPAEDAERPEHAQDQGEHDDGGQLEPPERERAELTRARRRDLLIQRTREAGPAGRARGCHQGGQSSYLKESLTFAR